MRAISLLCIALFAVALAAPAGAEPARHEGANGSDPFILLVKKENGERGRQDSRREERRGPERENRGDRGFEQRGGDGEREDRANHGHSGYGRTISPSEAAQRAQRRNPGRVLGVRRQPGDEGYSVNVLDERGRLRVIRVPAEDE
ncbi:MAG: hypothetical protein ACRETN_08475 [Nevskiales bacterium]